MSLSHFSFFSWEFAVFITFYSLWEQFRHTFNGNSKKDWIKPDLFITV